MNIYVAGQKDTFLSDIGRHQAELLGVRLKNEKFTHVFTSDLHRAKEVKMSLNAIHL